MVVASAVADMVRAVFDGQVVDEATKAREAVFRDTNRVNAVLCTADAIANEKVRFLS